MLKKITFSLFLMVFSLSTFLSIPGIIPLIAEYFSVHITMASLFVALFALILSVTGLFLPSYFSKYERKRFFIISLSVFILSSFLQIFIDNFYHIFARTPRPLRSGMNCTVREGYTTL